MNKSFYHFLVKFGLFNKFIVDDDDGAGGNGGGVEDIEIEDENDIEPDDEKNSSGENVGTDDILQLQQKIKDLEEDKEAREHKEALDTVLSNLKSKHPEFKAEDIENHLKELYKTDPEKAESLNNAVGYELVYLQEFAPKPVDNDEVNFGRNGGVDRRDEVRDKIKDGGSITFEDKRTLLSKYL